METYYFIEKSSVKKGPLKYSDLKSECLNKNDLVWSGKVTFKEFKK